MKLIDLTSNEPSKILFFFKKKVKESIINIGKVTAIVTFKEDEVERYHNYRKFDNGEMTLIFEGELTYIMGELHVYPKAKDLFEKWRKNSVGTMYVGNGTFIPLDHVQDIKTKHEPNPVLVKWYK